jgi:hypothetical protein
MTERAPSRPRTAGFTLPAVLVVAAAMLILAIGLLALINIERKTARSFADSKRAELAARAGLEDFRAILRAETANDEFLVIGATPPTTPPVGLEAPSHLFIARGEGGGDSVKYRYLPLFSSNTLPPTGTQLEAPAIEEIGEGEGSGFAAIDGPPWLDKPRVEWIPVTDSKGALVARYAYWVEDLQGKIDATTAGNDDGEGGLHTRNVWPFPAPGINPEPPSTEEPKLDRVALHALDPAILAATEDGDGKLLAKVREGRPLMLSPDSMVAAVGTQAPLARDENGLLEDPLAAALEKSTSPVIQHYDELATVPFAAGISADAAGEPKLNLNALLGKPRASAIDEFANWIDEALPNFVDRKGGFPDDYLKTLAANAFDYVDTDNDPTVVEGSYRGLDGYPLVSEFLMTFRWDDVVREDGRLLVIMEVSTFIELWNMTDQPVQGQGQVTLETKFDFPIGANPGISFEEQSTDPEVASPVTVEDDGYYWHPAFEVNLRPNEFRVYTSKIRFRIDAGSASGFVESPIQFNSSQPDGESGYRFRWNGVMVDQSRGNTWKTGATVYYPAQPRQVTRATIPGHGYALTPANQGPFQNNMGDPRMSFYLGSRQASNLYPNNYSPNRRTIRWGSIYSGDSAAKRRHYGRVLPAEWPDGGHNFPYGSNSFYTTEAQISPNDPRFFNGLPTPVLEQAPMRLSNRGRFFSATELGRTYDPVMWTPAYGDLPGSPGSGATDTATLNATSTPTLPTTRSSWPDVELASSVSNTYGGGNTLRIGRFEHGRFERPGLHAAHLLDLFHAGEATATDDALREGDTVRIAGHVNLNTADRDALRALAAGFLKQDPILSQTTSNSHQTTSLMALPTAPLRLGAPARTRIADRIAEGILQSRPFASAADIASARDRDNRPVFGNREMYPQNNRIQWTDSAAEEVFARVYDASTLRSRNFRIWVIGQALAPVPAGSSAEPQVLSESKKAFTVFADPGERDADGRIDPANYRPRVIHENDF